MQTPLSIKIDIETYLSLDRYCKQAGIPKSNVVTAALEEYLAKRQENKKEKDL